MKRTPSAIQGRRLGKSGRGSLLAAMVLSLSAATLYADGTSVVAEAKIEAETIRKLERIPPLLVELERQTSITRATVKSESRYGALSGAVRNDVTVPGSDYAYRASYWVAWNDEISVDAPGRTGTKGFVTLRMHLSGNVEAVSTAESRIANAAVGYAIQSGRGAGELVASKSQVYTVYSNGTTNGANFLGTTVVLKAPFIFGERFPLFIQTSGATTSVTQGGGYALATTTADWNGFGEVTDAAGNPVSDYTTTSDTGLDFSKPITAAGPTPPPTPTPTNRQIANISSRARVGMGEDLLIGGFIVSGPAGSKKKVVLRGLGPSLEVAGLKGALSDPVIELYGKDGLIQRRNGWKGVPDTAQLQEEGLAPTQDAEAAMVVDLLPGNYTVILSGNEGRTGIAVVEIYDIRPGTPTQLANISSRARIGTGDDVLIGGFILSGSIATTSSAVMVRALGPSLGNAGVGQTIADPSLEVFNGNGSRLAANDDWKIVAGTNPPESQEEAIRKTGIPPADDREAAIYFPSLSPGPYTAIVRGKNASTGIGLVEIYGL